MTVGKTQDIHIQMDGAAAPAKTGNILTRRFSPKTLHNLGQIVLWVLLVVFITMTPIMMRFSHLDAKTYKIRHDKYIAPSVNAGSFLISIFLGFFLTAILNGKKGLLECFNFKMILLLAPASFGYAISENLALSAMANCAPIMYAAIHKTRLMIAAIMTRVFLRRKLSMLLWIICITVTFTVMAFVFYAIKTEGENKVFGVLLLIANITLSVSCSIYADFAYKKNPAPLHIQMVQGRFTAFIGSSLLTILTMVRKGYLKYGPFGSPSGGWDSHVIILMFFFIARDWVNTVNLKVLDAMYKSLGGSAAVATTYIVDALLSKKEIVPTKLCLVFAIMFGVIIYAQVKQMEKTEQNLQQKVKELEAKMSEARDVTEETKF